MIETSKGIAFQRIIVWQMVDGGSYRSENAFVLVETHAGSNVKLFPFDFKPFISFLRMPFAVTLTGILSWKEHPNTLLAAVHKEPGADG